MKTWQKVLLGVVAGVAVIVGLIFWLTSGITDSADRLFAAARSGNYSAAYAETSQQLQSDNGEARFTQYLKANGLDKIIDTSWSSRSISGGVGELTGTLETESGGTIPATITLVSESDAWKVDFIDIRSSGLSGGTKMPTDELPAVDVQVRMVHNDTIRLINALDENDPQQFLEFWVDNATLDVLEDGFATLPAGLGTMALLAESPPEIISADIDSQGIMTLSGRYENETDIAVATFGYIDDAGDEKIVSYRYKVDPK